jgi:CheY-like chemotaxis protein
MTADILIVEDEGLVGLELGYALEDMGHHVVGIAADADEALQLARMHVDVALVDVNLADGPTGMSVGRELASLGVSVIFTTANPAMLGSGVEGAVGVVAKPYLPEAVAEAVDYALKLREGRRTGAPRRLQLFRRAEAAAAVAAYR